MTDPSSGVPARTVDDLSIATPPSPLSGQTFDFRHVRERSSSDSDLGQGGVSILNVDKTTLIVGRDESVKVSWDIKQDVTASDWIGLYPTEVTDSGAFWDSKSRGSNGGRTGEIVWQLEDIDHHLTKGNITNYCLLTLIEILIFILSPCYKRDKGKLSNFSPRIQIHEIARLLKPVVDVGNLVHVLKNTNTYRNPLDPPVIRKSIIFLILI